MINQFMISYFEESTTTNFYIESLDNVRASLIMNTLMESHNDYYFEASRDFKQAIKDFFAKLIQAIKDLVKKIKDYIHEKLQNIQMNKKLAELKKSMVANRNELGGKKVTILDTTKYMIAYRKYINLINVEFKKLTAKKYENSDAFQKEAQRVNELIDSAAEKLGLTSSEKYAIETDVFNALSIAEKSIKLYDNEFNVTAKEWEESIRTNGKTAEMEENPTIADRIKVLSHKFSNTCSKCFQFMSKHPIASISIITAAVVSVIAIAHNRGTSHGKLKYMSSDTFKNNLIKQKEVADKSEKLKSLNDEIDKSRAELKDAAMHNYKHVIDTETHAKEMRKGLRNAVDAGVLDKSAWDYGIKQADEIFDEDHYNKLMNSIEWDAPLSTTKGKYDRKLDTLVNNRNWGISGAYNIR